MDDEYTHERSVLGPNGLLLRSIQMEERERFALMYPHLSDGELNMLSELAAAEAAIVRRMAASIDLEVHVAEPVN